MTLPLYLLIIGSFLSSCLTVSLLPGKIELGKIAASDDDKSEVFEDDIANEWLTSRRKMRKRSIGKDILMWPNGTVFYTIDSQYDTVSRSSIASALQQLEMLVQHGSQPCVRFVNRTFQENYVFITPEKDQCYSWLGMRGGRQITSLGSKCLRKGGKIIHEMMHVLGFLHEQSRFDRDNYVRVLWDNIQQGQEVNFEKYDDSLADSMSLPYDYGSLMHYSPMAFSKNGDPTIAILPPQRDVDESNISATAPAAVGQREGPSKLDVQRVRLAYGCAAHAGPAAADAIVGGGTGGDQTNT